MSWRGYNNITIRAKNKGKNGWALSSSKIYTVDFDPSTKHYNMDKAIEIKASEWLDLNKPIIVRIVAHTSFGNDSNYDEFYVALDISLSANICPVPRCLTFHTFPNPPFPIILIYL